MFLDLIRRRNPGLIEAAIRLHQEGRLPANTTVIDLDTVAANAGVLAAAGDKAGLEVFAMTKQMGRNGDFLKAIKAGGIGRVVAVDMECARAGTRAGLGLGHVGHLVQVPRAEADAAAALSPDYWTVFNLDKAREAAAAMARQGRTANLLIRIHAAGDRFYPGHEGGFPADEIVAIADAVDALPGARFAGITTFPALLFDNDTGKVQPTHNLATLAKARDALARAGRTEIAVNAPGTTSSVMMPALAEAGATQAEPGHGLTGTTPLHAIRDLPERPAAVYLSEVSHLHAGRAYCFGGGLYIDPVFPDYEVRAVVAREPTVDALASVAIPPPAAIDYYGMIDCSGPVKPEVGDSVVFGFRQQTFVTRAYTAGIRGISGGNPSVATIHDAFGRPADWPS